MGFACQGLWVTGYCGLMGYGLQIPAHQLGGPKMAWDFRGYGLSEAWVRRVSTVYLFLCGHLIGKMSEIAVKSFWNQGNIYTQIGNCLSSSSPIGFFPCMWISHWTPENLWAQ